MPALYSYRPMASPPSSRSQLGAKAMHGVPPDGCDRSECSIDPLHTLDQLLDWQPSHPSPPATRIDPVTDHGRRPAGYPRTLVCHDMKGGYLESDKYICGCQSSQCYGIHHWQYMDTFVYFSHNFVTIPPPCWVAAAHKHGVKVLGTLITEWTAGADVCRELLRDPAVYKQAAHNLVTIAHQHGFDGWLINIENEIEQSSLSDLVEFVRYLTASMVSSRPSNRVIWYDSVTDTGELDWQNELNLHNRQFFDVCHGIFLNYAWTTDTLDRTVDMAGTRLQDVYVGVDVWARGCIGGLQCIKPLSEIRERNLSLAVFAPGWVYETQENHDQYIITQDRFWHQFDEFCHKNTHTHPFSTSFCRGFGEMLFSEGTVVVSNWPWTNLLLQNVQPSYSYSDLSGPARVFYCTEDGYEGGGCLQVEGVPEVPLFATELRQPVFSVCIVYKPVTSVTPSCDEHLTSVSLHCEDDSDDNPSADPAQLPDLQIIELSDEALTGSSGWFKKYARHNLPARTVS